MLHKDAKQLFGTITAPARMKLQLEVSMDLATPVTALPDELKAASSATLILESLPVISGPWNYLQSGSQMHSSQLMARERKAWRDKYLRTAHQNQKQQDAGQHARRRQKQQSQVSNIMADNTVGSSYQPGLPPRPRSARRAGAALTLSIPATQPSRTGEELESDFIKFMASHRSKHRQRGLPQVQISGAEDQSHIQLEEYNEDDFEFEGEHEEEVMQGRTYTSIAQQVRADVMLRCTEMLVTSVLNINHSGTVLHEYQSW